jgi:sugar phosphate isomerase/epimerase
MGQVSYWLNMEETMYYSGFADEAGASVDKQIQATQALGWDYIESRNIDGENLTDISDRAFETVCEKLAASGVKVNCFGSAIANWGKDPRSEADYLYSLEALERAIPRMQRLGTRLIRGMSFAIVKDGDPDSADLEQVIFQKMRSLVKICEDGGVTYVHENCQNYGGLSYQHTLRLIEKIDSPNFKLAFDTGNPVGSDNHIGQPPYHKQNTWEFYQNVKSYIEHVHIKDCRFVAETGGTFPTLEHTFPGEGDGDIRRVVKDLIDSGYTGALSIEPHLVVVYHEDAAIPEDEIRYSNYIEYGRRLMKLVDEVRTGKP